MDYLRNSAMVSRDMVCQINRLIKSGFSRGRALHSRWPWHCGSNLVPVGDDRGSARVGVVAVEAARTRVTLASSFVSLSEGVVSAINAVVQ